MCVCVRVATLPPSSEHIQRHEAERPASKKFKNLEATTSPQRKRERENWPQTFEDRRARELAMNVLDSAKSAQQGF